MANGKALKNMPININVPLQYNSAKIDSVREYLRFSQYGKLVIIDVGGLVANDGLFAVDFTNMPTPATRFVTRLFRDISGTELPDGFMYSSANGLAVITFAVPTGFALYG